MPPAASPVDGSLEERSDLVLALARVLYVNGQATDEILAVTGRLGPGLGLHASIMPRWGELHLYTEDEKAKLALHAAADPTGVDMDRVAGAMRTADAISSGRLAPGAALQAIRTIAQAEPAPTWLFALAAGAGAVALAVLFGVQHGPAAALIFASAGAGAVLRRALARYSANAYLQPCCAGR